MDLESPRAMHNSAITPEMIKITVRSVSPLGTISDDVFSGETFDEGIEAGTGACARAGT